MATRNFSLALDESVFIAASTEAARRGATLNSLVANFLQELAGCETKRRLSAREVLHRYSLGKIPRTKAMQILGLDYDGLLARLETAGFSIPELRPDERQQTLRALSKAAEAPR